MNGDDGVQARVLAGKQRRSLTALDLGPQRLQFRAQFAPHVLPFTRQLQIGLEIGQLPRQAIVRLDLLCQALAGGENSLGRFLVLPEVRLGYLLFDDFEFAASLGGVKENSGVRRRDASVPRIAFPVPRSRLLLSANCPLLVVGCWSFLLLILAF
jgi:hypothetical protein